MAIRRSVVGYVSQFLRVLPRIPTIKVVAEPFVRAGGGETEAAACRKCWPASHPGKSVVAVPADLQRRRTATGQHCARLRLSLPASSARRADRQPRPPQPPDRCRTDRRGSFAARRWSASSMMSTSAGRPPTARSMSASSTGCEMVMGEAPDVSSLSLVRPVSARTALSPARGRLTHVHFMQRTITRAVEAGGESTAPTRKPLAMRLPASSVRLAGARP